MKSFNEPRFALINQILGNIIGKSEIAASLLKGQYISDDILELVIDEEQRANFENGFRSFDIECRQLNLTMSSKTVNKIINVLQISNVTYGQLYALSHELAERLKDEMESIMFFSIELDKYRLLSGLNLFGKQVAEAFPSAVVDIEEAGKCLVFERVTACVFHLMRVMEVGLRVLENTLRLPPSTNPNWGNILDKCTKEQAKPFSQKTPEWQSNGKFLVEATALLMSVKNAWRNPTMHIEKVYTVEQAEDIWNAVKGFMRHLATKLKE